MANERGVASHHLPAEKADALAAATGAARESERGEAQAAGVIVGGGGDGVEGVDDWDEGEELLHLVKVGRQ